MGVIMTTINEAVQKVKPLGIWGSFKAVVNASAGTLVTTAQSVEDTVKLYQNEVHMISTEQRIRLDAIAADREGKLKLIALTSPNSSLR